MFVQVETGRAYTVRIERGCFAALGETVKALGAGKAALVSDSHVFSLYGGAAEDSLKTAGLEVFHYVFPEGEKSKNLDTFGEIVNFFSKNHLTRGDVAVALGGGVVGDVTGFAAACYLRGIRYIQVPTTLLAMVDSSVGGKTAVDLGGGKNLCGAFWQPSAVLCDPELLQTLDREVFTDGCGEVVKYAMLGEKEIENILLQGELIEKLDRVIGLSVTMKRDLVSRDERDTGARRLLNFGHTLGHGLELLSGYTLSHGYCVVMGMEIITRAAVRKGFCPVERYEKLQKMIELCKLSKKIEYSSEDLYNAACMDKKVSGSRLSLIVPDEKGCRTVEMELCGLREWIET